MKKYGTGEVTGTEDDEISKQASKEFTDEDSKALAEENEEADG